MTDILAATPDEAITEERARQAVRAFSHCGGVNNRALAMAWLNQAPTEEERARRLSVINEGGV